MNKLIISNDLSLDEIKDFLNNKYVVELSEEVKTRVVSCRKWLDDTLMLHKRPIYGINTGFGSLCNIKIPKEDINKLQENLMISHACGVGEEVPDEIVKIMLLLKIQNLSYGHSAVQLETIEALVKMLNTGILPVVYDQGSLGASGDLSPLAHLCLPIIGKGEVKYKGKKMPAENAIVMADIEPVKLMSKEGLALLNGTQFMQAYGIYVLIEAEKLSKWSDIIASISIDAYHGLLSPFNNLIHELRPHNGQIETASRISKLLYGSEISAIPKSHVQDPYSFRCIPQVHGASKDAINYVKSVFEIEINSVTDNPTVFPDDELIISAGNFHGQPLALPLDFIAIALAELANISERRVYQLISGKRDLPGFLVGKPGLNSGFMIPQYTAASIVSQNKVFCHPASVDSIESSQGQEDHVSMGSIAATKALKVCENLKKVLAIELLNAVQAIEFRRPMKTSDLLEEIISKYRKIVPFVENDMLMYPLIHDSIKFLDEYEIDQIK